MIDLSRAVFWRDSVSWPGAGRFLRFCLPIFMALICWFPIRGEEAAHAFHLSASSYLGDGGDVDEVMGVRILSDGTLVVAAIIGEAQPRSRSTGQPVPPILLNGAHSGTPGAIVRLTADGREVLSVTRFTDDIRDLEIDAGDNLYIAAGFGGLIQLNGTADTLLNVRQQGAYVKRVTTSAQHVATLVPDSIQGASITPGPGDITFYARSGLIKLWEGRGWRHTLDLAIDEASQTVAHIGWRQANVWQENSQGVLPVQISYLRGLDFEGNERWLSYDWDTNPDIDGHPLQLDPATGIVQITNPRFLNSTGQPTGNVDALGRPLYGYLNNMADTRGYRLTLGEDGYLYGGFEAAGGNHIFRAQGERDTALGDFRVSVSLAGGDFFNSFINTGASHKTYIARFDPATGKNLLGNQFNTLIDSNSGQSANTLRIRLGGLFVDADGRLYFGGAAASGLPLPGNLVGLPMEGQISLEPFGLGSNEGGAYLWVVDSDLATRLFVGRTANGSTRSVHARVPQGASQPVTVWGGRAALTRPMYVYEAFQPQPGYGANDGFVVVLGDTPVESSGTHVLFSYGGSGVDYVETVTRLRGMDPDTRSEHLDGSDVLIVEYPFSETLPLNPPGPAYTGPAFFGGVRAVHRDPSSTGFSGNSYSGSSTSIRIQKNETRSQALFYFPLEGLPGVGPEDRLSFDGESYLLLNGGSGGFITGGRWLVRDGETFYVSEETTASRLLTFQSALDNGGWAVLDIDQEDPLAFEVEASEFAPHVFSRVTAVGFIQLRPEFTGDRFSSQWDALEASLAVNAEENLPPVAVIEMSPQEPARAPVDILLDAGASYDPDGELTFFHWSSGDAAASAGPAYVHTYTSAGTYTATLTVWDAFLLEDSATITFPVVSPQTPRPERTVVAWGGNPLSANIRSSGNEIVAVDLSGNGQLDDTRRGTGYREDVRLFNTGNLRGTPVYGGLWLSTLGGDNSASWGTGASGFHVRVNSASSTAPSALHGVFLIQKKDFFGEASHLPVGLQAGDQFHMKGINRFAQMSPLRWLVREGDQVYVSLETFNADSATFTVPADNDHGQWAAWDPAVAADHLNFDEEFAEFSTRTFRDVTAFGVVLDHIGYAESRIWFAFEELVFEGAVLTEDPPPPEPEFALYLDFGNAVDAPDGFWNTITGAAAYTDLLDFQSGTVIPTVVFEIENTGGSGLQLSNATQTWGARQIAPEWGAPPALSDRMWVNRGDTAVLRFENLRAGSEYQLEIASSFAGDGRAGEQPGIFSVTGGEGAVAGFNAHSGDSLGTQVYWTSRGPDDGGNPENHAAEGWMIWPRVQADAAGRIEIHLSTTTHSLSRASVNALRLTAIPDTFSSIRAWRMHYFGREDNAGEAANLANPAGDGIVNLMKYALGLAPDVSLSAAERRNLAVIFDALGLYLELRIPQGLRRDILYRFEWSEDLQTWHPLAEATGENPFEPVGDAPAGEEIRVPGAVRIPLEPLPAFTGFYRIRVSPQPD